MFLRHNIIFLFCFVFSQGMVRFIYVLLSVEVVNRARLLCQLSLTFLEKHKIDLMYGCGP